MDIPKSDVGGSNRGAKASPGKSVRVYPSLSGAATECAPKPASWRMAANPQKCRKNNAPLDLRGGKPIV
jgi:hypothetical protein